MKRARLHPPLRVEGGDQSTRTRQGHVLQVVELTSEQAMSCIGISQFLKTTNAPLHIPPDGLFPMIAQCRVDELLTLQLKLRDITPEVKFGGHSGIRKNGNVERRIA